MTAEPVLLIHHVDLPSLAAAGLERAPERLVLWGPGKDAPDQGTRRSIVERQAAVLGAAGVIEAPLNDDRNGPEGFRIARMLLEAASSAIHLGARRVVWPVSAGGDLDAMARAIERAGAVHSLLNTQDGDPELLIDLPVVDLHDEQLVCIADDSGLPLDHFQPCEADSAEPCGGCRGCRRWRQAFDEADVPWPWAAAVAQPPAS